MSTMIFFPTSGAVDEKGEMPYYAEKCAAMMAVTFSSGGQDTRSIVSNCISFFFFKH